MGKMALTKALKNLRPGTIQFSTIVWHQPTVEKHVPNPIISDIHGSITFELKANINPLLPTRQKWRVRKFFRLSF